MAGASLEEDQHAELKNSLKDAFNFFGLNEKEQYAALGYYPSSANPDIETLINGLVDVRQRAKAIVETADLIKQAMDNADAGQSKHSSGAALLFDLAASSANPIEIMIGEHRSYPKPQDLLGKVDKMPDTVRQYLAAKP